MTRRRRIYAVAGLATVAVIGVAVVAGLGPFAASTDTGGAEPLGLANRGAHPATMHTSRPPELLARRGPVQVDLARVEAALARLEKSTASITAEQIEAEQHKMLEAKARFEAIKIAEPKRRKLTDSNGIRWVELQHESGEIRYELDSEEEAPRMGSDR
jgi:hypothetical protein